MSNDDKNTRLWTIITFRPRDTYDPNGDEEAFDFIKCAGDADLLTELERLEYFNAKEHYPTQIDYYIFRGINIRDEEEAGIEGLFELPRARVKKRIAQEREEKRKREVALRKKREALKAKTDERLQREVEESEKRALVTLIKKYGIPDGAL